MLPFALMPTKRWTVPQVSAAIEELKEKFVVGSFHKAAKISPAIFDAWSNLANRIPQGDSDILS